jgi:hypothetical protein
MLRNLGRATVALVAMAAGMAVATPAQAAGPVIVDISCEPTTAYHVICFSTVSGGTGPYTRNWFYNDRYFPSQDNKSTTSWSCTPGGTNKYTLAAIDATSQIAFDTTGSGCNSGNV